MKGVLVDDVLVVTEETTSEKNAAQKSYFRECMRVIGLCGFEK